MRLQHRRLGFRQDNGMIVGLGETVEGARRYMSVRVVLWEAGRRRARGGNYEGSRVGEFHSFVSELDTDHSHSQKTKYSYDLSREF